MELITQQCNMNLAICLIKQNNWAKVDTHLREAAKVGDELPQFLKLNQISINTRKKAYYWACRMLIRKL